MPQVKTYGKKAASKKIWQLEGPAKEVEVKEPAKSVPHKSKDINVKPKLKDVNVDIRGVEDDPINDLVAGLTKVALDEAINPPAINESGLDHVESKDAQNVQSAQTALAETLTMLKDEHDLEVNVTSW